MREHLVQQHVEKGIGMWVDWDRGMRMFFAWWIFMVRISDSNPDAEHVLWRKLLCTLRGCSCRVVGSRRMSMRRFSPGKGVNRRSFAKQLRLRRASRLESCCADHHDGSQECTSSNRPPFHVEHSGWFLVDCGSVMEDPASDRVWHNKCVQKSVFGGASGRACTSRATLVDGHWHERCTNG